MAELSYEMLAKDRSSEELLEEAKGVEGVDKSSHFYHVMTRAWGHESIFSIETAHYRQRLLGKLCESKRVTILFSVTMPNHTHDVFMAGRWEDISYVLKMTNSQVSRKVRKEKNWKPDRKVFDNNVLYVAIKDIANLLYIGKYIFDNPERLTKEGKPTPYSCFWFFENAQPSTGYDKRIYSRLFGMDIKELLALYSQKSKNEVWNYSVKLGRTWADNQTKAVFYVTGKTQPIADIADNAEHASIASNADNAKHAANAASKRNEL